MLESCKQNSKITGVMFMYKCWVNPGFILTASWSSEVWKFWRCSVDGSELHVSLMEVRTCWAGWRCKATFSSRTRLNSALRAQLDFDCWLSLLFVCLFEEKRGMNWGKEFCFLSHIYSVWTSGVSHFLLICPVLCGSLSLCLDRISQLETSYELIL